MGPGRTGRIIAFGGAGLALAAGGLIAWLILARSPAPSAPPPASQGGLVVVSGREDDAKLDPSRPLRCFVGGRFVGELPLSVCAQRNGVATGSLDVGLDQAGALAATNGASSSITPLPPQPSQAAAPKAASAPPAAATPPASADATPSAPVAPLDESTPAACWRYGAGGWRRLPNPMTLALCVQALYAGRCPQSDDAFYGRWDDQTLRLTGGRVEISSDNRDFASLVDPWPPCGDDRR
jgi:hypothetical protein